MDDRLDMTGLWHGTYTYPAHSRQTTPFAASSSTKAAGFPEALSNLPMTRKHVRRGGGGGSGRRAWRQFGRFHQDLSRRDMEPLRRLCRPLSADGQSVTGMWSVEEVDGTFEMHRDLKLEELQSRRRKPSWLCQAGRWRLADYPARPRTADRAVQARGRSVPGAVMTSLWSGAGGRCPEVLDRGDHCRRGPEAVMWKWPRAPGPDVEPGDAGLAAIA